MKVLVTGSCGYIGEDPNDTPNNLMPYIARVALGRLEKVRIYGNDYDAPDGTGVHDYIHVGALNHLVQGVTVYTLGSGRGISVIKTMRAFEKAAGKKIPYEIAGRRSGDLAVFYADAGKANRDLGWKTRRTFEQACADTWRWQFQKSPRLPRNASSLEN